MGFPDSGSNTNLGAHPRHALVFVARVGINNSGWGTPHLASEAMGFPDPGSNTNLGAHPRHALVFVARVGINNSGGESHISLLRQWDFPTPDRTRIWVPTLATHLFLWLGWESTTPGGIPHLASEVWDSPTADRTRIWVPHPSHALVFVARVGTNNSGRPILDRFIVKGGFQQSI